MDVYVIAFSKEMEVTQVIVQSETNDDAVEESKEDIANFIFENCEIHCFDEFYDKVWSELGPLVNWGDIRNFLSSYGIGFSEKRIEINQTIDWD